jgi:branched-chain amino acid transport system ATP-binding protein
LEQNRIFFQLRNLKINYGGAEILKGISLDVGDSEIVTLIGSNGAGKTTTLRAISGLLLPAFGEIWFEGEKIDGMSPQDIVKAGISQVPQNRALFPYMSVLENLKIGAYLRREKNRIKEDLERFFLSFPVLKARHSQKAGSLSGGEQQMLAIACALMAKPRLVLLDEPSTGLSPIMVAEISNIVANIHREGTSVLLVEQNARMALGLAHRGYVLETGSIVLQGKAADLANDESVKKAYMGE